MLHRQFGNLDYSIPISFDKPFLQQDIPTVIRIGVVEEVDSESYVIKVRDSQSGQRGIICVMSQPQFSTLEKSGTYNLPTPESKVIYYMDGGNSGVILGNVVKGTFDDSKDLEDGISANPGFEAFGNGKIKSDFGWGPGDQAFINERGKIKLAASGIIVLKSAPFCFQYMLPAKQARLSQFMVDEERGIGYIKRRRSYFCLYADTELNCNYKVEQMDDIPSFPETIVREETGFSDRMTALSSANHQSDMDVSGHLFNALENSIEILKARAIRRTMIAKTRKASGTRILFAPVYKEEKRIDGTVVEQIGNLSNTLDYNSPANYKIPLNPFYNLEIVKSPLGYVHIICRDDKQLPTAVFKMDARDGSINIAANALTLSSLLQPLTIVGSAITLNATTSFEVNAPIINLNASAQLGLTSQGTAQLAGAMVDVNAQTAMTINAPSINSYPVPAALPPSVPAAAPAPILAGILEIDRDNTPFDEVPVD
jgi:hypothetical protein